MPFKRRVMTDPMPTRIPDVEIIFHGQILLRADERSTSCQAALNPIATNHVLSIEARTKVPGQADVIRMRHVGPLDFRSPEGMTIDLSPRGDTLACWACVGEDPIDYADGSGYQSDFRWILNFEGEHFHKRQLETSLFDTQHVIKLQGGEYFFRTGVRSAPHLNFLRSGGGADDFTFRRIGAVVRAGVYLARDQSVFINWVHEGAVRSVSLTKSQENIRHEIYIENTPLFDVTADDLEKHEELLEYYKVIDDVDEEENRFTLQPFIPEDADAANGEFGTPSIPCQVMRLDYPYGD